MVNSTNNTIQDIYPYKHKKSSNCYSINFNFYIQLDLKVEMDHILKAYF